MVAEAGFLGASFFCSRDYLNRKELKNIFPTLAYQLACRFPEFRNQIIRLIKRDPSVAQNALISQFKDLIIDPLSFTNLSCVIVVDALDESVDDQPASAILFVLGRHIKNLPSVKFFITGGQSLAFAPGFASLSWNRSPRSCYTRSNRPTLMGISGCTFKRSLLRSPSEEVISTSRTRGPAIRT